MKKSITTLLSTSLLALAFVGIASSQVLTDTLDSANVSSCVQLTKGMTFGSRDATTDGQVSDLQFFLNDKGYLKTGPTGYFGSATLAAVKEFQGANGITQNGVVGPITRGKIATITCSRDEPTEGGTDTTPTNPTTPVSQIGGLSVSLSYTGGGANGSTVTIPGGQSLSGINPLAPRTWTWTTTGAASVSARYTISGENCGQTTGLTVNEEGWQPWLGSNITGTRFSGSNTRSLDSSYYGCTVLATYKASDAQGKTVTSSVKVVFSEKNVVTVTDVLYNCNGVVSHVPCTTPVVNIPVCGQPPMATCPTGAECTQVMPQRKTYANKSLMFAEGASYIHQGECEMTTSTTALSCGAANGTTITRLPGYVAPNYYCNNGQPHSRNTTSETISWKCSSASSADVSCGMKLSYASTPGTSCGQATGVPTSVSPTTGLCASNHTVSNVTFDAGQREYLWACQNSMVPDQGPALCKAKAVDTSCSNTATCNPITTSVGSVSVGGLRSSYKTNEIMTFSVLSSNLPTSKDVNITSVLKRKVDGYVGSIYTRQNMVHLQSSKINGLSTQNTTIISSTSTAANNNNLLETLVPGVYTLTTKIVSCEAVQDCASHTAGWWRFNEIGSVYASTTNEVVITDAFGNINPICQFGYTWKIGSDGKTESCVPDYLVFVATSTVNPSHHSEVSRITASNCTIKAGFNTCVSNITVNTAEITTGTMTLVMASSTGKNKDFVYYYNGVYIQGVKTIPVTLGAREERLMLYVNNRLISQTGASGVCESGTTWNGSVCFSNTAIKKPTQASLGIWSLGGIIPKSLIVNADAPLKIQISGGSISNGAIPTYKLLVDGVEDRRTKKPSAKQSSLYYEGTPAGFGLTVGDHVFSAQVCNQAGCSDWTSPQHVKVLPAGTELYSVVRRVEKNPNNPIGYYNRCVSDWLKSAVYVKNTGKPIILSLLSDSNTVWNIEKEAGANIVSVIVGGGALQSVSGVDQKIVSKKSESQIGTSSLTTSSNGISLNFIDRSEIASATPKIYSSYFDSEECAQEPKVPQERRVSFEPSYENYSYRFAHKGTTEYTRFLSALYNETGLAPREEIYSKADVYVTEGSRQVKKVDSCQLYSYDSVTKLETKIGRQCYYSGGTGDSYLDKVIVGKK